MRFSGIDGNTGHQQCAVRPDTVAHAFHRRGIVLHTQNGKLAPFQKIQTADGRPNGTEAPAAPLRKRVSKMLKHMLTHVGNPNVRPRAQFTEQGGRPLLNLGRICRTLTPSPTITRSSTRSQRMPQSFRPSTRTSLGHLRRTAAAVAVLPRREKYSAAMFATARPATSGSVATSSGGTSATPTTADISKFSPGGESQR